WPPPDRGMTGSGVADAYRRIIRPTATGEQLADGTSRKDRSGAPPDSGDEALHGRCQLRRNSMCARRPKGDRRAESTGRHGARPDHAKRGPLGSLKSQANSSPPSVLLGTTSTPDSGPCETPAVAASAESHSAQACPRPSLGHSVRRLL